MRMRSVDKLIDYVAKVSKEPINVDGEQILKEPVRSVALGDKFFRKDDCKLCGRCCINQDICYTVEHFETLVAKDHTERFATLGLDASVKELWKEDVVNRAFLVNGAEVVFSLSQKSDAKTIQKVFYPDRGTVGRCKWLLADGEFYKCSIHPVRPITCRLPHLRFFYRKDLNRTILGVSQYGRNWALGCPVTFEDAYDEQSVQDRIVWLEELLRAAEDMKIKTYLPEILEYLEAGNRAPMKFYLADKKQSALF